MSAENLLKLFSRPANKIVISLNHSFDHRGLLAEFLASQCIETIIIYLNTFQYITMIHLGTWCHLLGILQS